MGGDSRPAIASSPHSSQSLSCLANATFTACLADEAMQPYVRIAEAMASLHVQTATSPPRRIKVVANGPSLRSPAMKVPCRGPGSEGCHPGHPAPGTQELLASVIAREVLGTAVRRWASQLGGVDSLHRLNLVNALHVARALGVEVSVTGSARGSPTYGNIVKLVRRRLGASGCGRRALPGPGCTASPGVIAPCRRAHAERGAAGGGNGPLQGDCGQRAQRGAAHCVDRQDAAVPRLPPAHQCDADSEQGQARRRARRARALGQAQHKVRGLHGGRGRRGERVHPLLTRHPSIARMGVAREYRGSDAMAVLILDDPISPDLVEEFKSDSQLPSFHVASFMDLYNKWQGPARSPFVLATENAL